MSNTKGKDMADEAKPTAEDKQKAIEVLMQVRKEIGPQQQKLDLAMADMKWAEGLGEGAKAEAGRDFSKVTLEYLNTGTEKFNKLAAEKGGVHSSYNFATGSPFVQAVNRLERQGHPVPSGAELEALYDKTRMRTVDEAIEKMTESLKRGELKAAPLPQQQQKGADSPALPPR